MKKKSRVNFGNFPVSLLAGFPLRCRWDLPAALPGEQKQILHMIVVWIIWRIHSLMNTRKKGVFWYYASTQALEMVSAAFCSTSSDNPAGQPRPFAAFPGWTEAPDPSAVPAAPRSADRWCRRCRQ